MSLKYSIGGVGAIVVMGLGVGTAAGEEAASPPCVEDRSAFMAMDYWTFDQAPEGVRSISDRPGCDAAAADLTRDYHAMLRERGEPVTHDYDGQTVTMSEDGEMSILYWHEGQLRAFAGNVGAAANLFRKSLKPEEENYQGWNQYALASIAFLEKDLEALQGYRGALAERVPDDNLNLGVVDGLIACFDRSYADAYSAADCNRRPRSGAEND